MQAWCNGKHVGEIKVQPQPGRRHLEIVRMEPCPVLPPAEADELIAPTISRFTIPLGRRSCAIDEFDLLARAGSEEFFRQVHGIPADASRSVDYQRNQRIFTWSVAELTVELYEEIFDHDLFEAVDFGPPDMERRERELMGRV